ncbi:hypothetical protein ALC60_11079 [Trachymyrmex zeteki]|uniref:Uncharacterized protein n=1 Tax=Mycetomoellerius zeteki TaxID=64791 RepID=A0A151WPW1_9HYME|nr:hypothetical protein ALC60_11079 [Trachymyrmex zeteki]
MKRRRWRWREYKEAECVERVADVTEEVRGGGREITETLFRKNEDGKEKGMREKRRERERESGAGRRAADTAHARGRQGRCLTRMRVAWVYLRSRSPSRAPPLLRTPLPSPTPLDSVTGPIRERFFRKTLLTIRSINNSFRSLLALRELKTIQVCASRATSIRRNEEKSPVKVHGSSQTFHFDFPRAPLSFIKIDALKAVRDWGSRSSYATDHGSQLKKENGKAYLSANRMDTSRNRIRRMVSLLWFCFFFAGVLAEGTLEKLHEGRIGWSGDRGQESMAPRLLTQQCLRTRLTLKLPPEIATIPTIVEARFGREERDSLVFALSETILADERIRCSPLLHTLSFPPSNSIGMNTIF